MTKQSIRPVTLCLGFIKSVLLPPVVDINLGFGSIITYCIVITSLFTKLAWADDSEGTLRLSSLAAHFSFTLCRLHTFP